MKRIHWLLIFLLAAGLLLLQKNTPKKEIHYHAGFVVFKDDKKIDFSDIKYMHVEPCEVDGEHEEEEEDEQLEKAHLHDEVGYVVHVHRNDSHWQDLFKNINYPVPDDVEGYINGKKVDRILGAPIEIYKSAVFFIGKNSNINEKLKKGISPSEIKRVEKAGESC